MPELMQIEVVDDCSDRDDPESVVKSVGRGRVAFYRKPKNGGAIANFNSCIERSRGRYVHILHGDDTVMPGYYDCISKLIARYPNVGIIRDPLFLHRCSIGADVDIPAHGGFGNSIKGRGDNFITKIPIQFAGVTVPRERPTRSSAASGPTSRTLPTWKCGRE